MSLPPCVGEKMRETTRILGVSLCLHHAVEIQMTKEPRDWPKALDRVPDECRDECEDYLRGIASRMRVARGLRA